MRKQIPWWVEVLLGIMFLVLSSAIGGVIGDFLKPLGGLILVVGVIIGLANLARGAIHGKEKA
jgi:hypothetical protein